MNIYELQLIFMANSTIILSSPLTCEIGAAAMYHCLDETSAIVIMSIQDAKDFNKTCQIIGEKNRNPKKIIMIGTYWSNCLKELLGEFEDASFILYCFGETMSIYADNLLQISGTEGTGPAQFLLNIAKENSKSNKLVKLFENQFGTVIKYIDDRIYNRNIIQNQIFYTGFFNYDDDVDMPWVDKFIKLFQGDYDLNKIMSIGQTIVSAQMGMARERVKTNSKQVTLADGTKAVVTEAPDIVNLSHDALHQKYPEAHVTIVMNMKFGSTDRLAFSIRSFDSSIDASNYAKKIGGDGNQSAAGGQIPHEYVIPF